MRGESRQIVWVAVLGAALAVTGCERAKELAKDWGLTEGPSKKEKADQLLDGAHAALDRGDTDTALKLLEQATQLRHTDGETFRLLGRTQASVGQHPQAVLSFKRAAELLPQAARVAAFYDLAGSHYALGELDPAVDALDQALTIDPSYWAAGRLMARILLDAGKLERAQEVLQRVIESHPNDGLALALEGDLLVRKGETERAERVLKKAVSFAAGEPDPLVALARLHHGQGEVDKAIDHLRRAVELDANHGEARRIWGEVLLEEGEHHGAVEHFREAARLRPWRVDNHARLAEALHLSGNDPEAEEALENAIWRFPQEPRLHTQLGLLYMARGGWEKARGHFRIVQEVYADHTFTAVRLAVIEDKLGNVRDAVNQLELALQLDGSLPEAQARLASLLAQQGVEIRRAKKLLRSAVRQQRQSTVFLEEKGQALLDAGDLEAAARVVSLALKVRGTAELRRLKKEIWKRKTETR